MFSFISNPLYLGLERSSYDLLQTYLPKIRHDPRILLVDVDEKSLAEVGAWPWPRQTTAKLLSNLTNHYQVAVLGLDVIFPDHRPQDDVLQNALSHPAITLAQTFDFNEDSENHVGALLAEPLPSSLSTRARAQAYGYIANHNEVLPLPNENVSVGHITPKFDHDGKVRRLNPIICFREKCSLALGLRLLQTLYQPNALSYNSGSLGGAPYLQFAANAASIGSSIPMDRDQSLWIPYRVEPGGFEYLSATDVLQQKVPIEKLRNTIVILGSTALSLGDRIATPQGSQTPGLEIHAQVLSAALDAHLITPLDFSSSIQKVLMLLFLLLLSGLIIQLPLPNTGRIVSACIGLSFCYLGAAYGCLSYLGLLIPLVSAPLFLLLSALMSILADGVLSNRKLARVAAQSRYFLPSMLVSKLLNEQDVAASTESMQLSVLVADMRGFTHASEGKTPEQVALLAQKCLETLSETVIKHGGIIEKYTGDGLMAIWGVGIGDSSNHARQAFKAAQEMQNAIYHLDDWFLSYGFGHMKVSIGINSGNMAVGIFGKAHRAWSAHGDEVNLASRIEQLTRVVGTDLLVGKLTAQLIGVDLFEYQGSHAVKGRDQLVEVYSARPNLN